MPFHLLRVGKTGSSALRLALQPFAESHDIRLFKRHAQGLAEVPPGGTFGLVIRDPTSRYVSGFNSRLRQGRPRWNVPWSPSEAEAFARFKSAVELAEALDDTDAGSRSAAEAAMSNIQHVRWPIGHWVGNAESLRRRLSELTWVGEQETLAADFEILKRRIGLPPSSELTSDPVEAHRSPEPHTPLSVRGRRNIETWYRDDYELLAILRQHKQDLIDRENAQK